MTTALNPSALKNAPTRDAHLSAAEKIGLALSWVGRQEPIAVPTVLTRWTVRAAPDRTPTLGTNGRELIYNPAFVDRLSLNGTKAIVLHAVGHVLSQHHHRRGNLDPVLWNIATDLALNGMLQRGYLAAFGSVFVDMFNELIDPDNFTSGAFAGYGKFKTFPRHLSAEEYVRLLRGEAQRQSHPQSEQRDEAHGQGGATITPSYADIFGNPTATFGGGIEDCPVDEHAGVTAAALQREDENIVTQAALLNPQEASDKYSKLGLGHILSGTREKLVLGDAELAAQINWRRTLEEFLKSMHNGEASYARINRRLHNYGASVGLIFPCTYERARTNGAVLVDTSGSMGDKDCDDALIHTGEVLCLFPEATVNLLQCDTEVRVSEEYRGGDFPPSNWKEWCGRGGTDLISSFRFIQAHRGEFDWAIVVTDGEFSRYGLVDPGVPVLWVLTRYSAGWSDQPFPFGKVVCQHANPKY